MDQMQQTFDELSSAGGNFVRLSMSKDVFSPEWENLGVYDEYGDYLANSCAGFTRQPNPRPNNSNRQFNCWALDQIFNKARATNIYLQVNVERDFPINTYFFPNSTAGWGAGAYVQKFAYEPTAPSYQGPYNFSKCFVSEDLSDPDWMNNPDGGSFYYWKRFYKYFMSRWSYSTNLAVIETFNEINTLLGYGENEDPPDDDNCSGNTQSYGNTYRQQIEDAFLGWHQEMTSYIKSTLDENSIGGYNHLMSVSYVGPVNFLAANSPLPSYFSLFYLPGIDIMDIHNYDYNMQMNEGRWRTVNEYVFNSGNLNQDPLPNKPFQFGECSTLDPKVTVDNPYGGTSENSLSSLFDNYETTFHNMLWATALNGSVQPGQTWQNEVVHWWEESVGRPRIDEVNTDPSNTLDIPNHIHPNGLGDFYLPNKKIYSHFLPLSNFFKPVTQGGSGIDIVNNNFISKYIYHPTTDAIECYYLIKDAGGGIGNHAYGWVHNVNKYVDNHKYYQFENENYLGCTNSASTFRLSGLDPNVTNYQITFFPTYVGQNPPTAVCSTDVVNNEVVVTLSSNWLGCGPIKMSESITTVANSDVAFVVHPANQLRLSQSNANEEITQDTNFAFDLYPNPANKELYISINQEYSEYKISIFDVTARIIIVQTSKIQKFKLDLNNYPKGVYFVKVQADSEICIKKLILQ